MRDIDAIVRPPSRRQRIAHPRFGVNWTYGRRLFDRQRQHKEDILDLRGDGR